MEIRPKIKLEISTTHIANQFICAPDMKSLMLSYSALAIIIGMLIKKEKSKASCLSVPANKAEHKVEPLLEIPGNKAML